MNTSIKNENLLSKLEFELLTIAEEFNSTQAMLNNSKPKSIAMAATKSRIENMKLCIKELMENKEHKRFILSLKSWTADIFIEDKLLNRDEVSYATFAYPFCNIEQLYKITIDDDNESIILLDRNLYRNQIKKKSRKTKSSISKYNRS